MSEASAARRCALRVLHRVSSEGAYGDRAFQAEADRARLDARDRAFAQALAYGVVQRRRTLDHVIARLASRELRQIEPPVLEALRLGVFELVFMGGVPDRAAVSQAVELARAAQPRAAGFANAVLRAGARDAREMVAALPERTPEQAALRHSHPDWIARAWWTSLGPADARALLARDNDPPESAVRANTLRVTARELRAALALRGVAARPAPGLPEGVVLGTPYDVHGSELFAAGALMPQSRGSMLVARVVAPRPGERILDLCAAPGAKATHLAALGAGRVVAVERHAGRAAALAENCRRLGASNVEVVCRDAADIDDLGSFDRVLLDPPCSDLGTLQARPDARWRKTPDQIAGLTAEQARLLRAAAERVRPGGALCYSTCTVSSDENERQMAAFLAVDERYEAYDLGRTHPGLTSAADGRFLQLLPHRDGTDGFFVARLQRRLAT